MTGTSHDPQRAPSKLEEPLLATPVRGIQVLRTKHDVLEIGQLPTFVSPTVPSDQALLKTTRFRTRIPDSNDIFFMTRDNLLSDYAGGSKYFLFIVPPRLFLGNPAKAGHFFD
jgi:hypothetical protein